MLLAATCAALALLCHPARSEESAFPPDATSRSFAALRTTAHNTHIAHTRLVIEGPVVLARVRMFRDDLEKGFKQKIAETPAGLALVGAHVARQLVVRADGVPLAAEVLDGGPDQDGDQPIWWVLIQWKAAKPVVALGLKVHVLFDTFDDQQNLVVVNRQPGDDRRTLYFQGGDRSEQVVKF